MENGQNTEKSPGDLRRLAVTQNSREKPSANTDVKNSEGVNKNKKYFSSQRCHVCQEKRRMRIRQH